LARNSRSRAGSARRACDRPVPSPADPNILILSNVKTDGKPTGLQDAGSYFHTDYSYLQVPARATLLYSIVVPKVGGDTLFANQQAAYDDLPEAMKKKIEPLYGIHHYGNRHDTDEASRTAASPLTEEQKAKMPLITHRIARPHPVTGRNRCTPSTAARSASSACRRTKRSTLLTSSPRTDAVQVSLFAQVRRRRRRHLGQRVAAALGDADRPERCAHAVADHGARAGAHRHGAASHRADVRENVGGRLGPPRVVDSSAVGYTDAHTGHDAPPRHAPRVLTLLFALLLLAMQQQAQQHARSRTSANSPPAARADGPTTGRRPRSCALYAGGATTLPSDDATTDEPAASFDAPFDAELSAAPSPPAYYLSCAPPSSR
jgi:hypothetical protein